MTDIRYRNKAYSLLITTRELPVPQDKMAPYLRIPDMAAERVDISVIVRLEDSDELQEILVSYAGHGCYYVELNYNMDDFGWPHPLLLARDDLSKEEVETILHELLVEENDDTPLITNTFCEVSSLVFGD